MKIHVKAEGGFALYFPSSCLVGVQVVQCGRETHWAAVVCCARGNAVCSAEGEETHDDATPT